MMVFSSHSDSDPIEGILLRSGLRALPANPSSSALAGCLRALASEGAALDGLGILTLRNEAVTTLTKLGCRSPAKLVDAAFNGASQENSPEVAERTYGPGIVDIVLTESGETRFVAIQDGVVSVTERVDGQVPWSKEALPWAPVPAANDVSAAIARGGHAPFAALVDLLKRSVVLPEPVAAWSHLLVGWILSTYLLELWDYMAVLLLEGPPARGKSRLSKVLAFTSYRGYLTPSPTAATLFRDRARHRITMALDTEDMTTTLGRGDLMDLVLTSFERSGVVRRCTRPDAAPDKQIEAFATYGATLLITNKPIPSDSPLATRCLRICLPEAGAVHMPSSIRPEEAAGLRAEAVAWAAHVIADPRSLPTVEVPLGGRLRDVATPLLRVLALVAPDTVPGVTALLASVEAERRSEASRSPEARVAMAMWSARTEVQGGRLFVRDILRAVNEGASGRDSMTAQQVGNARKSLGLAGGYGGANNTAYVVWPGQDVVEALHERYSGDGTALPPVPPVPPVQATSELALSLLPDSKTGQTGGPGGKRKGVKQTPPPPSAPPRLSLGQWLRSMMGRV